MSNRRGYTIGSVKYGQTVAPITYRLIVHSVHHDRVVIGNEWGTSWQMRERWQAWDCFQRLFSVHVGDLIGARIRPVTQIKLAVQPQH